MTSSDAIIATTALLATVRPNVGPTELEPKLLTPYLALSARLTLSLLLSGLDEIWNWVPLPPISWTTGEETPWAAAMERTDEAVAGWFRATLIRAPEVKSMPRFNP